ncbi:MAG: stage sporulation protein [Bacillota bacterium]|jgi:stage II sporulation protein D|nr:stage sporulation protein [Bacillota bacterium]MDK2881875.1 stage sporulation protein [Bacillota bacterium]MDK2960451.1 stage sporulation protein [Bacillota bacterium]
MIRNRRFLVLVIFFLLAAASGCLRRPQQSPLPSPEKKPQATGPVEVARSGREPTLSLYDNQTGQRLSIKLEDYVAGVVAAEMNPKWPVNALAAQAILARTFTLQELESKGGTRALHGTDVSTKVEEFQAYDPTRINDNVRRAVEMTRGEVATYGGKFIRAWFSAYAGPRTAVAKEGLAFKEPEPPYIQSVKSPGVRYAPPDDKNWTVTFTRSEIEAALAKMGLKPGGGNTVSIVERGPTGRAVTLNVYGTKVNGADFRVAIGNTRLKSILIDDITTSGDRVAFRGRGYGHGVGMCQWGAYAMAKEGKSPEDIIRYFFKGVRVERLYR